MFGSGFKPKAGWGQDMEAVMEQDWPKPGDETAYFNIKFFHNKKKKHGKEKVLYETVPQGLTDLFILDW